MKYWNGISFEKHVVTHGDKTQEVVIAMSEDEYKDTSYREYLSKATIEKTRNEMQNAPTPNINPGKRKALGEMLKERLEFKRRQEGEFPKKYF